ncbi:MAG: carbohydrate ABC transporter permease [bacterium]|nr:carbohydrate ABC transporter permease [bacterium]
MIFNRKVAYKVGKQLIACILSSLVIVPFLVIFLNSFKTEAEAALMDLSLPKVFRWENYSVAIERGKLIISFFNSSLYSIVATIISVIINSMAAFVLSRRRTKLNQFLYFFMILGIMLPTNYIALIKVMQILHLLNTRTGIILLYTAINVPFGTFILYGFVETIPRELDEAGVIDGASPLQLFFRVIFPLLKPAVVTVALLTFMGIWNDFMLPLYVLNRASQWPMTLAVYNFFGQYQSEWNLIFADIVLTCFPVFIIYLLGQKWIVSGMTAGAVKG